jgi:hypothetical protein
MDRREAIVYIIGSLCAAAVMIALFVMIANIMGSDHDKTVNIHRANIEACKAIEQPIDRTLCLRGATH